MKWYECNRAYKKIVNKPCGEPRVESALIDNASISIHDAGKTVFHFWIANDAYMTAILFLKLWYKCGFNRDSFSLLNRWNQEDVLSSVTPSKRDFLQCVNTVDLYHMVHPLPLRLENDNNLLNTYQKELCYREDVLVIENIAPVEIASGSDS